MFRRFLRRRFDGALTAELIPDLIRAYGKVLERTDLIVSDVSRLPTTKDRLVLALKAAWLSSNSEMTRGMIEVSWVALATFQEGVGDARIRPPNLPRGIPSPADLVVMQNALKWMDVVNVESAQRLAEIQTFKAGSSL